MIKPGFLHMLRVAGMFFVCNAYSFTWQDLWVSPDKQAEALMKEGQFAKAGELFQQAPWKAAASYRAKNYKQAAQQFGALQNESGYYNQGNALAQMGQYQDALKAYDKALVLNPSNQDAIYNRKLVEELLKQNQDKQQNKQSDNKPQDNQNNKNQQDKQSGQSGQDKQNQPNNNQKNENNQGKQEDKEQQESGKDNKDESGKDSKDESGKDSKEQQDKEQQAKDSKAGEKQKPEKNEKAEQAGKDQTSAAQTVEEREKQQAKEQWLKLIPDDPGGLMREKFLRDYIRRQRGWQQ